MKKQIKKLFPWLVELKKQQRINRFYKQMEADANRYAKTIVENTFKYKLFEDSFVMINENTGMDLVYQENKVFNLKLAAKKINNVVIRPGEVFSYWQLTRHADEDQAYKDGLVVIDGELTTAPAGGLCHISNLLCWLFLHSPFTILDRTGHRSREFPNPDDILIGVDATIMEGVSDLKVKNETNQSFQIQIEFDSIHMIGRILSENEPKEFYKIKNQNLTYMMVDKEIYEEVDIVRESYDPNGDKIDSKILYTNKCHIGYQLPENTIIREVV